MSISLAIDEAINSTASKIQVPKVAMTEPNQYLSENHDRG